MLDATETAPLDVAPHGEDTGGVAPVDAGDATASTDATPQLAPVSGQPRDTSGRFATADPSATRPTGPSAPAGPTTPSIAPETIDAPPAPPAARAPLTFKVSGQQYDIPGSFRDADGNAVIPSAHVQKFLTLVGQGRHHETTWNVEREKMRAEATHWKAQADQASHAVQVRYEAMEQAFMGLIADPDLLIQAAQNPAGLKQYLEREAKLAESEFRLQQMEQAQRPDPSVQRVQLESAYRAALEETMQEAAAHPDLGPILSGPYGEDVRAMIESDPYQFATQDTNGAPAFNVNKLASLIRSYQRATAEASRVRQQQQVSTNAQAFNAGAATGRPVTPPAPKPAPKPATPPTKKSWADLKKELLNG
jgi:hypothetical protein